MALYAPFVHEADGKPVPQGDIEAEAASGPPANLVPPGGAMLLAAVGLYRAAGYREVADYNGNAKADLWFEREL